MDEQITGQLLKTARDMATTRSLSSLIRLIMKEGLALSGAAGGYLVLLDADAAGRDVHERLFAVSGELLDDSPTRSFLKGTLDMRESKATIISLPKELPEHSTAAGAQKLLCVPFGPGGRIEGGFILADPSEDPAGGKLVLLQLFGELAKAALENALIFEGMEAQIQYLLNFDELLTKLPNRRFFKRQLDEVIASSSPTARVALLFWTSMILIASIESLDSVRGTVFFVKPLRGFTP